MCGKQSGRPWHRMSWAILLLALAGVPAVGAAAECTKVVFSAHPQYPPFHWHGRNGMAGATIEITRRILSELGIPGEARFVGPWPRVLKAAEHGEIDLVVGLKDTPERQQYLEFTSAPFFDNPMAVFAPADAGWPFKRWEDLVGRKGGVNAGDKYGGGFDEFLVKLLTVEASDNLESNFNKLAAGRIDYFITGLFTGRAYLLSADLVDRIKPMAKPVTTGYINHGFSRRSPCRALVSYFNKRLAELRADGTTAAAVENGLREWARSQSR